MPSKDKKEKQEDGNGKEPAPSATTTKPNNNESSSSQTLVVYLSVLVGVLAVLVAVLYQSSQMIPPEHIERIQSTATRTIHANYEHYFGNMLEVLDDPRINITRFRETWNNIQTSIASSGSEAEAAVGKRMAQERTQNQETLRLHPVFMVPGFITSGLELWQGHDCAQQYFRRKIWGSLETFRSFAQDTECWKQHLSLDPYSGLDPPGIRLRPSQGFEAADFWTSAFWVWDRVIRNLAAVGYDGTNMDMVSYDWRLSYDLLQQRDGHFSKWKAKIEAFVEHSGGRKAVIIGHSMGAPKVFYFLVWVGKPKEEGGGGGGEDWVERYVHAYVDLAGPLLGIPKAASALLSGEMKDTNLLNPIGNLVESLFGRQRRHELWSSWGSLWGMTPKGGDDIWGISADVDCGPGKVLRGNQCVNEQSAGEPTDTPFLAFTDTHVPSYDNPLHAKFAAKPTWSYKDVMEYLIEWKQGHQGPASLHRDNHGDWNDPTQSSLPHAPSLNVYCMYGVGLPTERIFHYRRQEFVEGTDVPFLMNDTVKDDITESLMWSVRTTNGDGTVPLLSLGYMCADGWKATQEVTTTIDEEGNTVETTTNTNPLNPGNSRIVPREYLHKGAFQVDDPLRQGPESSEHCDILGNHEVLEDLIKIALGEIVEPRIVSNIEEMAEQVRSNKERKQQQRQ